jgi:O-acetyl-ADP-ribose deacetylase (regulator of RNase III)
MLTYVSGDLFESPAQTLVNTVNTGGVMGKGIALQFKKFFPEMFAEYQQLCENGQLRIGTLHVYRTPHKQVLNFPTKEQWRKPSQLSYIVAGLDTFVRNYREIGVTSIAFPPLGCGNGELHWDDVRPVMEKYLAALPIPVYVYPPQPREAVAEHRTPAEMSAWLGEQPMSLPFDEVWRELEQLVGAGRDFATTVKQTPYRVEIATEEGSHGLRIRATGKTSVVAKQDLRRVWTNLRAHGFAISGPMDSIDSRDAAYIFPVFADLPYVKLVTLASDFDKFTFTKSLALQLVPVPRSNPEQRALPFAG